MNSVRLVYSWVQDTRQPLLQHLEDLPNDLYTQPLEVLAGESVRDRHVHVAGCYLHWLARVGMGEVPITDEPATYANPQAVRDLFQEVDHLVDRFIQVAGEHVDEPMARVNHDERIIVTPRWLLAHPITHEFHHKGQIVVALRLLGHPIEDSDLALPHPLERDPV